MSTSARLVCLVLLVGGELTTAAGQDNLAEEQRRYDLAMERYGEGKFAAARDHLAWCVSTLREVDDVDPPRRLEREADYAELLRVTGDYSGSFDQFQAARDLVLQYDLHDRNSAVILNNLAGLHRDLGELDEAERLLDTAHGWSVGLDPPDLDRQATAKLNLAEIYRMQERFALAEPLYGRALELYRQELDPLHWRLVIPLNQAAVFYAESGHPERGIPLREEALRVANAQPGGAPILRAQILFEAAEDLVTAGRCRDATRWFTDALELRTEAFGATHAEVGIVRARLAETLAHDGEPAAARPHAAAAVRILTESRTAPRHLASALARIARLDWEEGRPAAAIRGMEHAVQIVETLRPRRGAADETRAFFLARHRSLFDDLVQWYVERDRVALAFRTAERARARVLLDRLAAAQREVAPADEAGPRAGLLARRTELRLSIADARTEMAFLRYTPDVDAVRAQLVRLDEMARQLDTVSSQIRLLDPTWGEAIRDTGSVIDLDAARQSILAEDEGTLVFHVGAAASHVIWIPAAGTPVARPLLVTAAPAAALNLQTGPLTARALRAAIDGSRGAGAECAGPEHELPAVSALSALADRNVLARRLGAGRRAEILAALFQVLVPSELAEAVLRSPRVLVLADGALHRLPLESLIVERAAEGAVYWLDVGPVLRYASSATSLRRIAERPAPPGAGVLSMSDTRSPGSRALSATGPESDAVAVAFPSADTVVLRGEEATEVAFGRHAPGARYIHLATHGVVDEDRHRLLGGLTLTPSGADDDGMLHLFEIQDIPLRADLVVLSACHTQRGQFIEGEGVFALARAFLTSGARRVVASLWEVNDATSAQLVGDLFRRVAEAASEEGRSLGVAVALRDAKRTVRATWSDPYYWAPFLLRGLD